MRLELTMLKPDEASNPIKVLRAVVSQRNLLVMLVKLDDPTSRRIIGNTDVRWCSRTADPNGYIWAWDYGGWMLELHGTHQPIDDLYSLDTDTDQRRVRLTVTRKGCLALLGGTSDSPEQPRDYETFPFDETAPQIICEQDEFHYAQRPAGPALMAPQHEALAQELGAMPGEVGPIGWEPAG